MVDKLNITSFGQANDYLKRYYHVKPARNNLSLMTDFLKFLGDPEDKFKAVHIAGTSGKTSTAYYLSALLTQTSKKVGLTVSPNVYEVNERLQINGQPISEQAFCEALVEFDDLIKQYKDKLAFHQFMFGLAYWYFNKEKVDYAVIETAAGGLFDQSNTILRPDKVCLITDIGMDHMDILGNSLESIALHKAGVIHKGNHVLMYRQSDLVDNVIKTYAHKVGAEIKFIKPETSSDFRVRNWFLAYSAYLYVAKRDNLVDLSQEKLNKSKSINIPGRLEIYSYKDKTFVLDSAHNLQKIEALVNTYNSSFDVKPLVITAIKKGKNYSQICAVLDKLADGIIVTKFNKVVGTPIQAMQPELLTLKFKKNKALAIDDMESAMLTGLKSNSPVILITGSVYLIGQLQKTEVFSRLRRIAPVLLPANAG